MRFSKIGGKQLRHILYRAAPNAKKINAACKALYDRPWKKGSTKNWPLLPFATNCSARICRGKVRCAVPRRLLQKTGLKVWFFTRFVLGVRFYLVTHSNLSSSIVFKSTTVNAFDGMLFLSASLIFSVSGPLLYQCNSSPKTSVSAFFKTSCKKLT